MDAAKVQELKKESQRRLEQLKTEKCIAKLLREGRSADEIVASDEFNLHSIQRVQNLIADGEDLDRPTPKKIGWKRSAGLINDSEMMRVLKGWPYTFSEVKDDAVVQGGDWDDIEVLYAEGYLNPEEYGELLDATQKPEDSNRNPRSEQTQDNYMSTTNSNEGISVSTEQLLKEFSSGVNKCAGGVHKTSIRSIDEKAMAGVLFGTDSVLAGGSFQVSAYGRIPLHGLDDHYFGLRCGEIYGDDDCVHGDIEASIVVDIDDGECTSATLITKDDDGSVLLERRLDGGLTSGEVIESIQRSRIIMELKRVFKGSQVVDGMLHIPVNGDTIVVSIRDYLWNEIGENEEGKDSVLLTCTDLSGCEYSYAGYIGSMFPECRIVCQESWDKVRVSVPVLYLG
jgi:hypothetical protein